jgi:hypothetical protein
MNPSVLVLKALLRQNRSVALWLLPQVIVGDIIATVVINRLGTVNWSIWFPVLYTARYWLGVTGILLVVTSMRPFLANGVTRRDYTIGAGMFGAVAALGFAALLGVGQVVERWAYDVAGLTPHSYEAVSFGDVAGRVLPVFLAFLVSGALIGAAFYRFGGWLGILCIAPAIVPTVLADWFVGFEGNDASPLPYLPSVLIVLAGIGLGALALRLLTRSIAIRQPAS